jgi:phage baseplate assembly protein W
MNRTTGRSMTELEHLRQSVGDILSTPIGTRVMRREYGSQVPMLVDQPDNRLTELRLLSAAASALMRWEPRLSVAQMSIQRSPDTKGKAMVTVQGSYRTAAAAPAKALRLTVPTGGVLA